MEDRQESRFRPLTNGIPATPIGGIPVEGDGIPVGHGALTTVETVYGIPCGPIMPKRAAAPGKCSATTKKGDPCKAYALTDTTLCVGHSQ